MAIRLKIHTTAPLPVHKAWFNLDIRSGHRSIADLKTDICERVQLLTEAGIQPSAIQLLLDDFELLDDSSIDLVRDGDLVLVMARPLRESSLKRRSPPFPVIGKHVVTGVVKNSLKRKPAAALDAAVISNKKQRLSSTLVPSGTPSDSSDESSSDDCTGSSSSDSDSSDDSSADSDLVDSDSDSDSDSSSPPRPEAIDKTGTQIKAAKGTKHSNSKQGIPVPPGKGKPATHSRNLRRRIKRQYEHGVIETTPVVKAPKGSSAANLLPLGVRATDISTSDADVIIDGTISSAPTSTHAFGHTNGDAPGVMMASLRTKNKNKKRGFRNALTGTVPNRIVFDDPGAVGTPGNNTVDAGEIVAAIDLEDESTFQYPPRLIPPSERQERGQLPSNMFITSIDVELEDGASGAISQKSANKKANKNKKAASQSQADATQAMDVTVNLTQEEELLHLPLDLPADTSTRDWTIHSEWDYVENSWDQLVVVTDIAQAQVNTFIGCRALDINPITFTPEFLITVARVVVVSDATISIVRLARPGTNAVKTNTISFGDRKRKYDDNDYTEEEVGEDVDNAEEEVLQWPNVLSEGWKLLQ